MQSSDVRLQEHLPYWNENGLEGTKIGFSLFCEWFEVNIHNAKAFSWDVASKLLAASPQTELNTPDTDEYGNVRWHGGTGVGDHHVQVWYNAAGVLNTCPD